MSDIEEKSNDPKVATTSVAPSQIRPMKLKIKFVSPTNIHNLKREEIYKYIIRLHKRIRNLIKKCRLYKKKFLRLVCRLTYNPICFNWLYSMWITSFQKLKSRSPKAEEGEIDEEIDEEVDETQPTVVPDEKEAASNFIADIKNAAQEAQNKMGFIYEPTSGLYYDSRTGYYYNAVSGTFDG